jgi:zinc D-Ala-D-Ala carboxypeptidase
LLYGGTALDAISSITSRISQIETQLAAVRAGANVRAATGSATAPATGTAGSFASTYADALTSVSPTAMNLSSSSPGLSSSTVGTGASRLNKDGVPVELVAYGNGKIPANALHPVGNTGHKLWAPAADSLTALVADAKRAGVNIGITDSYRPYAEQVDLARRKGLYSQGGLAAKPGTSDHGWGLAVDLDLDSKAQAWMRANGSRYGFVEDTPREPWHWAYTPKA